MFMMPELLPAMLSVEALEDNEVLKVEGIRTFSRICDKKQKTKIELLTEPKTVNKFIFSIIDVAIIWRKIFWIHLNTVQLLSSGLARQYAAGAVCVRSKIYDRGFSFLY